MDAELRHREPEVPRQHDERLLRLEERQAGADLCGGRGGAHRAGSAIEVSYLPAPAGWTADSRERSALDSPRMRRGAGLEKVLPQTIGRPTNTMCPAS